ncbi:AFG1/ZapE family ATPase, partial [Pelagibacteraceae bacterium]|nr:AFG1/ZapE family ATPase [Pelagibacteraceae bacterium]
IIIENIKDFSDENMNQQQRFITMIDIIYEKKISLIVSANSDLKNLGSSEKLIKPFKRTVSRLYELTSLNSVGKK